MLHRGELSSPLVSARAFKQTGFNDIAYGNLTIVAAAEDGFGSITLFAPLN
jgi:hypothetical protein